MGSLKSGFFAVALTSLIGTAAVVGCSADGGGAVADPEPTLPAPDDGTGKVPPTYDSGDNSLPPKDAGKKDSGPKKEAGVDAGPPPPVEGTACPTINAIGNKPCGACGTAQTLCLDDGSGKGKWSPYGVCGGELAGGCVPGSVTNVPCGNCGTQVQTCNQYCAYTTTACAGEPVNNCKAGSTDYSGAGCPVASTYRNRTCSAACTWSAFSATCATPVNEIVLNIGAAAGASTSKTITFSTARMTTRLSAFDTCPVASSPSLGDYPYQYIELHNPSATKAAKVTVYSSQAPGGPNIDTIMAVYANPIQPMDDAARKACRDGVDDQSSSDVALTGNANNAILKAVAIPAGGSVLVYLAAFYEYAAVPIDDTEITIGNLNINTKVETLN